MKFGIDRLLEEPGLRKPLQARRVALLAHPASVTRNLTHSMDALAELDDINLTAGSIVEKRQTPVFFTRYIKDIDGELSFFMGLRKSSPA